MFKVARASLFMSVLVGLIVGSTNASTAIGLTDGMKRAGLNQFISSLETECTASGLPQEKCFSMKECVLDSMVVGNMEYGALIIVMANSVGRTVNGKKMEHFTIKMLDPNRPSYREIYLKLKQSTQPSRDGDLDKQSGEYISYVATCARRYGLAVSEQYTFLPHGGR